LLGHIDQPTDIFWRSRIYSSAAGGFAVPFVVEIHHRLIKQ
jgi:hypothetical protein